MKKTNINAFIAPIGIKKVYVKLLIAKKFIKYFKTNRIENRHKLNNKLKLIFN
jgi:hypothetical protein